jgi:hypothetical protein
MNWLVTTYYAGSLHISPMRVFDNAADAWKYHDELRAETTETIRIYQLFPDKPPIMLKVKKP